MQRPAGERREAGAEDRSGIDQVGVGDDALGECRPAPRQASDRSAGRRDPAARRPARPWPPCRPSSRRSRVRSCARVRPRRSARSVFSAARRRRPASCPLPGRYRVRRVSASSIGPDRHAEGQRCLIDGLRGDAFVDAAHRLHQVRRENAVDQESGRALDRQRQLVDLARERGGRRRPARRACAAPTTISTSIMRATGLKKCRPISRVGSASARADVFQRNARGVGCEQRRRLGLRFQRRRRAFASLRGSRRSPR